jgi:hypothetical protein
MAQLLLPLRFLILCDGVVCRSGVVYLECSVVRLATNRFGERAHA